jgi:Phage tail lysozyme
MATLPVPMEMRLDHERLMMPQAQGAVYQPSILARIINAPDAEVAARMLTLDSPPCYKADRSWAAKTMLAASLSGLAGGPMIDNLVGQRTQAQPIEVETPIAPNVPPMTVAIFDDSIGVGRRSAGEAVLLEARGLNVSVFDAVGGRQTIWEPCDRNPNGSECNDLPDVLRAMDRQQPAIEDAAAVMIRTGTNDRAADLEQELLRASRAAVMYGSVGDNTPPMIILSETFGTNPRVNSDAKNPIIDKVSQQLTGEGITNTVLRYRSFIDTVVRPAGGVSDDEVHLTPDGYKMMAEYDASIVPPLVADYYAKLYPSTATSSTPIPPASPSEALVVPGLPEVDLPPPPSSQTSNIEDVSSQAELLPDVWSETWLDVSLADVKSALSPAKLISNLPVASARRPLNAARPIAEVAETALDVSDQLLAIENLHINLPAIDVSQQILVEDIEPVTTAVELDLTEQVIDGSEPVDSHEAETTESTTSPEISDIPPDTKPIDEAVASDNDSSSDSDAQQTEDALSIEIVSPEAFVDGIDELVPVVDDGQEVEISEPSDDESDDETIASDEDSSDDDRPGNSPETSQSDNASEAGVDAGSPSEVPQPQAAESSDDEEDVTETPQPAPSVSEEDVVASTETPAAPPPEVPAQPESSIGQLTSEQITRGLYEFLVGGRGGMTPAGAAGLMGNFADESGLFPGRSQIGFFSADGCESPERLDPSKRADEGGTRGYGLGVAQWTLDSRQIGWRNYADSVGKSWKDLSVQQVYVMIELESGYFKYKGVDVLEILRTTDDVEYASDAVAIIYEGPEYLSNPKWHDTENYHNTLNSRRGKSRYILEMAQAGNFAGIDVACID